MAECDKARAEVLSRWARYKPKFKEWDETGRPTKIEFQDGGVEYIDHWGRYHRVGGPARIHQISICSPTQQVGFDLDFTIGDYAYSFFYHGESYLVINGDRTGALESYFEDLEAGGDGLSDEDKTMLKLKYA